MPALAALDGFQLRALSASSVASAQAAGERYGVPLTFASAGELAACEEVDLVVVSVKVPYHRELVLAALDAGKMVLCEWPLGNGLAEAEELAARADALGVLAFVGLQAQSAPALRYLRDVIAEGFVGDVFSSTLVGAAAPWGTTIFPNGEYLMDRANGATMITIPFGHTIDAFSLVLGEFAEVTSTLATVCPEVRHLETGELLTKTAADQLAVTGVLESGAIASVHFRGGVTCGTTFLWEINGSEGAISVDLTGASLQVNRITLRGAHGDETTMVALPLPAGYEVPALAGEIGKPSYNVGHAYASLLDQLNGGPKVVPTFADAVRRHRFLDRVDPPVTV